MCPNKSEFTELQALKKKIPISVAIGSKVDAVEVGTIFARLKNNQNIRIDDVLYVPGLDQKLLSVSALAETGLQVFFRNLTGEIKSDDRSISQVNMTTFRWMNQFGMQDKISNVLGRTEICEECMNGKSSVQPFGSSVHGKVKTKALLEVVHSDVTVPMRVKFKTKGEVFSKFTEFKALFENQFGKKIKCMRSHNGGEYINDKFANLRKNYGIIHQTTVPYPPQQNGHAERMNRTLTERASCMLSHMQVEEKWWAEAMNTAVYVTNRVPCAANQFKTSFEVCFGRKPSVAHFKVFGAQGYAHIDRSKRSKFDRKAYKCMFPGYFENFKGYRVWNLETLRLEITRSAKSQELPNSKYVEVLCCDNSMDRMNSMKKQHYDEEDMPLERQHNSDDAVEIDEESDEQDRMNIQRQKYGVYYTDTYAPFANTNSIRVYLSACCPQGFHIQRYDVDTAFLNGDLEEEVNIYPPRGVQAQAREVFLLKRAYMNRLMHICQRGDLVVYIALYVDDMLIGAKTLEEIKVISDKLYRKFKLKDLGKVKFMLKIRVDYDREQCSVKICKTSSINKMVEKFNQVDAKLVWNPNAQASFYRRSKKKMKE
uniref:Putative polyprotein n=1 Tax=Albugo laibachii Nc14 TaxID=890382 RepID=F0W8I6_9STRA|nr:putative polyprotein [Albugo laibachii Nc14]|eukprot:CCA17441.1 putative polyprotein [Albugo laibachii Nc14]